MKNRIEGGQLRFLVYKSKENYIGICFELGIVEEAADFKVVLSKMKNGAEAMLKAIQENKLDETHLNKRVSFKYELIWYLSVLLDFKRGFNLKEKMPVSDFSIGNVAPNCI